MAVPIRIMGFILLEQFPKPVGNGLCRSQKFVPWKAGHSWPLFDCRRAHDLVDDVNLVNLIRALEDGLLGEQLEHDASAGLC